jgi:hypothetical protein
VVFIEKTANTLPVNPAGVLEEAVAGMRAHEARWVHPRRPREQAPLPAHFDGPMMALAAANSGPLPAGTGRLRAAIREGNMFEEGRKFRTNAFGAPIATTTVPVSRVAELETFHGYIASGAGAADDGAAGAGAPAGKPETAPEHQAQLRAFKFFADEVVFF